MKLAVTLLVSMTVIACTPTKATRGNMVEDFRVGEIVPGVSTRTNVLKSLGSPTTQAPFDENVWYYIGQKTEKRGIFDPEIVEKKVLVVAFNEQGIVETIDNIESGDIDVPTIRRKTPTSGNEMTIVEQLLGNVGRFNRPKTSAVDTAGGNN